MLFIINIYTVVFFITHQLLLLVTRQHFLKFSSNSEVFTSELLGNLDEIFPRYYIHGFRFLALEWMSIWLSFWNLDYWISDNTTGSNVIRLQTYLTCI